MTQTSSRMPQALALLTVCVLAFGFATPQGFADDSVEAIPEKRIKVYAEKWKFTPSTIRVPVGTRLLLEFDSQGASHSFVIKKGYKINVPLPQGKQKEFSFVADKVGTFRFYCGRPCGDGCAKMDGELIVEPLPGEAVPGS